MTPNDNAKGVDGLFRELLDGHRASNRLSLTQRGRQINAARVAVAELVEAVKENRAATQAFANDGQPSNRVRYEASENRLAAALRQVEGK